MKWASKSPDMGSKSLGELIRQCRLAAGLTQEELSEKTDLSVRTVRNLEQDKVERPRRSTLQRLEVGLNLNHIDAARLGAAARNVRPPISPPADIETDCWPFEWFGPKLILGQLIEQFGPERVLVVPVLAVCRTCSGYRREIH